MPISIKEFNDESFTVLRGRAFVVLEFLKRNKDKAYISKEIADAVKSVPIAVTPILKKLVDDGLVDKKSPYYTLSKNDKRVIKEELKESEVVETVKEEIEPYEGENIKPELEDYEAQ